jgi:hypothetical protein
MMMVLEMIDPTRDKEEMMLVVLTEEITMITTITTMVVVEIGTQVMTKFPEEINGEVLVDGMPLQPRMLKLTTSKNLPPGIILAVVLQMINLHGDDCDKDDR